MDRTRFVEILLVYGLRNNIQRLVERFWEGNLVVARNRGCYSRPLNTDREVTQGDPFSPDIFKIVVDAVVRATLMEV